MMMITCCELALYIAIGAFIVILALLAMFFGYNLRLDARTVKLEKKNGHEQAQINELKKRVEKLMKSSPRNKRGVKN
jgi:cell division protein FtsL